MRRRNGFSARLSRSATRKAVKKISLLQVGQEEGRGGEGRGAGYTPTRAGEVNRPSRPLLQDPLMGGWCGVFSAEGMTVVTLTMVSSCPCRGGEESVRRLRFERPEEEQLQEGEEAEHGLQEDKHQISHLLVHG